MNSLKEELFSTLSNELNNNHWEFDGRKVVSAAVDLKGGSLALILSDGKTIEYYTMTIRRNHGRKRPQARNRPRTTGLRRKKR